MRFPLPWLSSPRPVSITTSRPTRNGWRVIRYLAHDEVPLPDPSTAALHLGVVILALQQLRRNQIGDVELEDVEIDEIFDRLMSVAERGLLTLNPDGIYLLTGGWKMIEWETLALDFLALQAEHQPLPLPGVVPPPGPS